MKIASVLAVASVCVSGASAKWGASPLVKPAPLSRALLPARGGGEGILGTPVTTDILAALSIAEAAIAGSVAIPFAQDFGSSSDTDPLPDGSFEAFCVRTAGYSKLNAALFTFLTVFKDMSPELAIAYSVIPCASNMVSGVLTGDFQEQGKNGLMIGAGSLLTFLGCQYVIFSGSDYATLGAQVLTGYHIALGGLGYAIPEKIADVMGADVKDESKASFFRNCFSVPILYLGVAYGAMLNGASAVTALSYRSLLEAGVTLINVFRKEGERLKTPEKTIYAILALTSIVGIGTQLAQDEE